MRIILNIIWEPLVEFPNHNSKTTYLMFYLLVRYIILPEGVSLVQVCCHEGVELGLQSCLGGCSNVNVKSNECQQQFPNRPLIYVHH